MEYPESNHIVYEDPSSEDDGETLVFGPSLNSSSQPNAKPSGLQEAEYRIELANAYKCLLHEPFFTASTKATQQAESEVRGFVQGRFEELLGMGKQKPTDLLSEDDVKILKNFVEHLRKKATTPAVPVTIATPVFQEPEKKVIKRRAPVASKAVSVQPAVEVHEPKRIPKIKVRKPPADSTSVPVEATVVEPLVQSEPESYLNPKKTKKNDTEVLLGVDSKGLKTVQKGNKIFKEMVTPDNKVKFFDITGQATPSQNGPQPLPTLGKQGTESVMLQTASQQIGSGAGVTREDKDTVDPYSAKGRY